MFIEYTLSATISRPDPASDERRGLKRTFEEMADEDGNTQVPKNDVYRARQKAKLARMANEDEGIDG